MARCLPRLAGATLGLRSLGILLQKYKKKMVESEDFLVLPKHGKSPFYLMF